MDAAVWNSSAAGLARCPSGKTPRQRLAQRAMQLIP